MPENTFDFETYGCQCVLIPITKEKTMEKMTKKELIAKIKMLEGNRAAQREGIDLLLSKKNEYEKANYMLHEKVKKLQDALANSMNTSKSLFELQSL